MHIKALYSGATQKIELGSPALSRDMVLMAFASCPCIFPARQGWLNGKLTVFIQLYWIMPPVPKTCLFPVNVPVGVLAAKGDFLVDLEASVGTAQQLLLELSSPSATKMGQWSRGSQTSLKPLFRHELC